MPDQRQKPDPQALVEPDYNPMLVELVLLKNIKFNQKKTRPEGRE